jgi:radical SAM superfamily enzyme YgiQ (UPF0313 family)
MPDSFEHTPTVSIRMPNGAVSSLAGNVDPHHRIAIGDLILVQGSVRATLERLMKQVQPDLVGLSVMTFQRRTAKKIIEFLRSISRTVRVVVGGYDPSMAPEVYTDLCSDLIDFIVRGEGEMTFCELLRAIETDSGYERILGLSFRENSGFHHNPDRPPSGLDGGEIKLPDRNARILSGYTMMGSKVDVVETSRGCTFDCSFCSIIAMRGRQFHTYSFDRVLADIRDARDHGARTIFLVDDNITLNVRRFEALCQTIINAGLNHIDYIVQAMTSAIANHSETLVPLMRQAGFRYVFLGIENILESDLSFLRAASKNAQRENGRKAGNATLKAVAALRRNKIYVVGGLIIGNPGDTCESIEANLEFARRYVDWPYIQHPTPYPRTPMTQDFKERGLIVDDLPENYDGTTAVVRTDDLAAEEIEFLRWRAERWMKLRHLPSVFYHHPLFLLRHGAKVLAHMFRGMTLKTLCGLENERTAFERYRAIRQAERIYI